SKFKHPDFIDIMIKMKFILFLLPSCHVHYTYFLDFLNYMLICILLSPDRTISDTLQHWQQKATVLLSSAFFWIYDHFFAPYAIFLYNLKVEEGVTNRNRTLAEISRITVLIEMTKISKGPVRQILHLFHYFYRRPVFTIFIINTFVKKLYIFLTERKAERVKIGVSAAMFQKKAQQNTIRLVRIFNILHFLNCAGMPNRRLTQLLRNNSVSQD
ncbi:hypothetical protein ACJX0J_023744, partial [Zea mays]